MPTVELKGDPTTGVAIDIIERLLPEWWSRFQPKNSAYGGVLAQGGGLGIKAFIPEINRKVAGIVNEIWHGEIPQGGAENAREKAMDLIGHLLILISNLDAKKEGGPRVGHDKTAIVDQAFGAARAARLKGEDGKAAGITKVQELMVQANTGEAVDTDSAAFLTIPLPSGIGVVGDELHNTPLMRSDQAARFEGHKTAEQQAAVRGAGIGFKTAEQLQSERWPNKALEDPVLEEQLCGNPRYHSPHVYHNLSHQYGPIDAQCPGNIPVLKASEYCDNLSAHDTHYWTSPVLGPNLWCPGRTTGYFKMPGLSGQEMLSNAEHNLVYLRRAFAGGDSAGIPKNCSDDSHHRAHNWMVPAVVTGKHTTYFCNGNAPYSDENPGPERL